MPVNTTVQIVGAKEAIRSLNKLEPGLRKQFAADATRIAEPAISEAQRRYNAVGWGTNKVRGVSRSWTQGSRRLMPWNPAKAARSVKIRLQGDRRYLSVVVIEQRDAGTAILESAGRKTTNALGSALGFIRPGTSRILGPALFSKRNQIEGQMEKAVLEVTRRVQRELN